MLPRRGRSPALLVFPSRHFKEVYYEKTALQFPCIIVHQSHRSMKGYRKSEKRRGVLSLWLFVFGHKHLAIEAILVSRVTESILVIFRFFCAREHLLRKHSLLDSLTMYFMHVSSVLASVKGAKRLFALTMLHPSLLSRIHPHYRRRSAVRGYRAPPSAASDFCCLSIFHILSDVSLYRSASSVCATPSRYSIYISRSRSSLFFLASSRLTVFLLRASL